MADYYGKYGFREQVSTAQIADVLMKEFPYRWKNITSCGNHIRCVIYKDLKITPINDHKPWVYSRVDALRIIDHINSHQQKRKDYDFVSSEVNDELEKRSKIMQCTKGELIDKALQEYFDRHPYEGKTHQELVELLERRDAEREDMYR
jgi:hypothetical protein